MQTIDIADIAHLPTQVAQPEAIHAAERIAENMFESAIGIVILIHNPLV